MSFRDIALPLIARGVPVVPLKPREKIAFLSDWPSHATTLPEQIESWNSTYPDSNCASVALARPGGIWIFEIDREGFAARVESETGQRFPKTFRVRSSPGKGHYYFRQTPNSIAMGNVQAADGLGELWSARVDSRYVVSPGSIHPKTGQPYQVVCNADIADAPDWLVNWCVQNKSGAKSSVRVSMDSNEPIAQGGRDNALASFAGKMRNLGMSAESIYVALSEINENRCVPPMDDADVQRIAHSIARYKPVIERPVLFGGKVSSAFQAQPGQEASAPTAVAAAPESAPLEREQIKAAPYPKFPTWAIQGTSIYEGLCKPICEQNTRYPEFMWMPAMSILLNYVGTRVTVKNKDFIPSLFMVLIGKRGEAYKTSSVEDAVSYFRYAGIADHASIGLKNGADKVLVFTAGSPEGLGKEMQRLNCKNVVLYYDELMTLTSKVGIDGSGLMGGLLSLYESSKFSNTIKATKDLYNIDPKTYCCSLIACCTDKNFRTEWAKMAGPSSGMDDRFFFLLQPEKLQKRKPWVSVPTQEGALATKRLIDKALDQKEYRIPNAKALAMKMEDGTFGSREEIRAEKLALGIAIDMGLDEIDEDAIDRAIAIVEYELAVKKYIQAYEAVTREGSLQQEIKHTLMRAPDCTLDRRDLMRKLSAGKYGTTAWNQAFFGLAKASIIAETGSGTRGDPYRVTLLVMPDEENDD